MSGHHPGYQMNRGPLYFSLFVFGGEKEEKKQTKEKSSVDIANSTAVLYLPYFHPSP